MTQHQGFIEEFMSTLTDYATGSYLREHEKEFWEEPFPPGALSELRVLLEKFLYDAAALDAEGLLTRAGGLIADLNALNFKYGDAIIEPEEEHELTEFIHQVLVDAGIDEEGLKTLPEFE
ncbi:hypothetical protein [Corynebacterium freiburgense]|uniref:hypothetical protein n=1 Tax=Corynebacterium freiburgense TaxID=556548 RepID=UPI0004019FC2|nr:hypothetical protein [Corynebacterium freiburgense]WJZ02657.1 hypothetical protein CFREI_06855 [Corynebacterium freiburgense]